VLGSGNSYAVSKYILSVGSTNNEISVNYVYKLGIDLRMNLSILCIDEESKQGAENGK
jgi:hypothetical protein